MTETQTPETTTVVVYNLNRPVAFGGTAEQAAANRETHCFDWSDPDCRCWNCDCRPSHAAASYPCGQEPPREDVVVTRQVAA
jgi:hypothetical protein